MLGLGGYLTGGGHSPISGYYGLATDNILEFQVVTPAGNVEVLNQCTNADLFFAFRGVSTPPIPIYAFASQTNANLILNAGQRLHLRRNPLRNLHHHPHPLPLLVPSYHLPVTQLYK